MAEVAPSAGSGGGGNRNFLLIIGGLAALLFIGLLALGAIFVLPGLLGGGTNIAAITSTPTRISIPATPTRAGNATATRVVNDTVPLAPGERRVILELEGNDNAILTTQEGGKASLIQKGKWQYDASSNEITISLTDINGRPFEDEIVIRVLGSDFSVVSYNKALHGDLSGIQLRRNDAPTNFLAPGRSPGLAAPNMQATATPDPLQGDYSGIIPNVSGNQRIYTLGLTPGGTAVLSIVETAKPSVLSLGTWSAADTEITVTIAIRDGAPVDETLVFDLVGTDLVGKTYDQTVYGADFVLTRDPTSPISTSNPAAGTYAKVVSLETPVPLEETATPIAITATPIFITATPPPGANITPDKGGQITQQGNQLPNSGLGEDLLLLFGGGVLLLGLIFVVRRMRAS